MMKKILFVDDEPNVLSAFERQMRNRFTIETALGPEAGLAAMKNWQNYSVIVADMRMPGMDGIELLSKVKEMAPDVVRVMWEEGLRDLTLEIECSRRRFWGHQPARLEPSVSFSPGL